jgi:hypothetical protein
VVDFKWNRVNFKTAPLTGEEDHRWKNDARARASVGLGEWQKSDAKTEND